MASLNPKSKSVMRAFVEPSLAGAMPDAKFQFERHGYFVADRVDHGLSHAVFNRIAPLRDTWGR
jgi:glutaminyl-tRNA synthetase